MEKSSKNIVLRKFRYPLTTHIENLFKDNGAVDEMLFIEHIADLAISTAQSGDRLDDDAYSLLDRAAVHMIQSAAKKKVTEEASRVFDKIWTAVQLNTVNQEHDQTSEASATKRALYNQLTGSVG